MSLSPVIGTEVPETANGVVTPVASENGPHVPVKCGESRLPFPRDSPEEESLGHTGNHVGGENRVYDDEGYLDTEHDIIDKTSDLSLHMSWEADPSVPVHTFTQDSTSVIRDTPEASNAAKLPGALPGDSAHTKDSPQQGFLATTDEHQTEIVDEDADSREEVEDGEKEKQDEEDDEKNESKWSQYAGGRTEVKVSYFQFLCAVLDYVKISLNGVVELTVCSSRLDSDYHFSRW